MNKLSREPLAAVALVLTLALTACGGGGGSSSTPGGSSGSSNTGGNGTTTTSSCTSPGGPALLSTSATSFTVTSNPSGLTVILNNGTSNTNVGTTPVTVTPSISNSAQTITIDPAGSCYQVQFTQNGSGSNVALFFNKTAYTAAQVNVSSIQSVMRSLSGSSSTSGLVSRGPLRLAGQPDVSQTMVYVHYSASALRAAGRSPQSVASSLGSSGSFSIATSGDDELHAVPVPPGQSIDTFANSLRTQSGVTSVAPVHLRYRATTTANNPTNCHFLPTSPCTSQSQQWDMMQIQAPNAWGYFGTGSAAFTAKSVKIAVIDTGFDCKAASSVNGLVANVVLSASIVNGVVNRDSIPPSNSCAALDTDGHGTNVAAIADAVTDNGATVGSGTFGFAGIGANAQLMIYRIFPTGVDQSAQTSDEAMAIADAVNNGAKVINLSLGSPASTGPDSGEQTAIQNAINAGVTVVAAAGNDGSSSVDYPAGYAGVISVGATSMADGQLNGAGNTNGSASSPIEYIASYSNYGPNLSIVAPGGDPAGSESDNLHWITNFYSTGDTTPGDTCTPSSQPDGACAAKFAGTSQATPHVTGAVALLLAKNSLLSPTQVLQYLQGTADDICSVASFACPKGTIQEGKGRLDIYRALASLTGDTNPPFYKPQSSQFIAFAYSNSFGVGGKPQILDMNYPNGIPLGSNGAFQIGDLPTGTTGYKIGVWYNAAGNGVVTAGDSFGFVNCSGQQACSAASNITVNRVSSGNTF